MEMTIELNGLKLYAHHGVLPQERKIGNIFEVTVHLSYSLDTLPEDSLEGTIDYAELTDIVKAEMAISSQLLEHVTGRIKSAALTRWPFISSGTIRIAKLTPPIPSTSIRSAAATLRF